jgi:transcriptional regulator with GAF, ATPase, and Fis domain
LEKENILKVLKLTRWKISGKDGAAELLKLPPTTLASRIKALGIERPI